MQHEADTPTRAVGLAIVAIFSVQLGGAFAADLFDVVAPSTVVLMRLGVAGLALIAVRRTSIRTLTREQLLTAGALGLVIAGMNLSFYQAIDRLPLAVAVTIELLGPLALAIGLARSPREFAAAALAIGGTVLLTGSIPSGEGAGIFFAVLAAAGWALYIVGSRRVSGLFDSLDGIGVALCIGAVAAAPFGLGDAGSLLSPRPLITAVAVAALSALIPMSLDSVALRSVPARLYGLLMSLSPVAAAMTALLVLQQSLSTPQLIGIALVMVATASSTMGGVRETRTPRSPTLGPQ